MASQRYRWAIFTAVFALSAVYFFIFSESGLLERKNLEKEKKEILVKINALKSEKARLQRIVKNYREGEYPKEDILKSNYIKPGEKVVFIRGLDDKDAGEAESKKMERGFPIPLRYVRILWIAISAAVVLLIVLHGRKYKEQ